MLRAHSYGYSKDPSNSFVEHRQALAKNITSLRDPQRLYMLGTDSPNIIDPIVLADHPENVELWLPSALTGGEGQYTQWVHCELIVGPETIRLAHTQQVNSGHIQKVPTHLPSPNPAGK